MAHVEGGENDLAMARQRARQAGHMQRAQVMLVAAGLTAFGIVAVAAAMMTTLL